MKHIRFLVKETDPGIFAILIYEAHIVKMLTNRWRCWYHTSEKKIQEESLIYYLTLNKEIDDFWPSDTNHKQTLDLDH